MSGEDVTRKNKLLKAQKKHKMIIIGIYKVEVPQEALFEMMKGEWREEFIVLGS